MGSIRQLTMFLAVLAAACDGGRPAAVEPTSEAEPATLVVATVNYPLAYFAKRIGGDLVEVVLPVPASADPAHWTPTPDVIERYQRADLILLNGAGYASWGNYSTLPMSKVVDTSVGFTDRWIELEEAVTHGHGSESEHSHRGWAFTTWLDPQLAAEQARAIAEALIARRPAGEAAIRDRLVRLEGDLAAIDARMAEAADAIGDEPLLFSQPVYQYLIARYGLNAVELHRQPGAVPDAAAWDQLDATLAEHPARWMLWEDQPTRSMVAGLEQRGIRSLVFAPSANVPQAGDFLAVMNANLTSLEEIAEALAGSDEPQPDQAAPAPTESPAATSAR